ncbi:8613_t:CDS:2 [Paraglomus brasilianum]|uniref:8613_t:CDS:1 n=1 Tax=Paraglomus brasilianum TaxID=144538 RepID=A0A9N9BD93_9GLOM|nr:8613_t:CDS:2 [Paraglomus brasilianum]
MNTQDDKWPPVYYALPENQISFEGFLINLRAYVAAIDWTEPWLPINTLASHYWNYFARQNYFDKNGLFVTAIFAFPALCNITLGICLILIEVLHLLRRVKVAQLKRKRTQTLSIQSKEDKEQHEQPLSAQVKKDQ